ncbi:YfiR family protein [Photobacterium sanctipauli]|nr:YfiR family protein [Photobacterium sanctipauli]
MTGRTILCRYQLWLAMSFALLVLSVTAKASSPSQSYSAHKIKTVYVYRLANFIRWPNADPIRYCVLGRDSITITLDKFFASAAVNTKLTKMDDLTAASEQCEVLYITEQKLNILQAIPQYPELLTISDSPRFLERGGMIELQTHNKKIKPALSLTHLQRANLSASSQLLRIAIIHDHQLGNKMSGGSHE